MNELIGTKINKWTLLAIIPGNKYNARKYVGQCECGIKRTKRLQAFKITESCVTCANKCLLEIKYDKGYRFNKWTVIDNKPIFRGKKQFLKCRCDCGHVNYVQQSALETNRSQQCRPCSFKYMCHKQKMSVGFKKNELVNDLFNDNDLSILQDNQ